VARATGGFTGELNEPGAPPDPLASLKLAHQMTLAAFRRANAELRAATRQMEGQRWSLRRGLRESALLARRAWDDLKRS
jgi:hypothetical protein